MCVCVHKSRGNGAICPLLGSHLSASLSGRAACQLLELNRALLTRARGESQVELMLICSQKENPGCSQLGRGCVFSATTHGLEEKSSSAPEEPACDPAASPDICDLSSGSDPTASDRSGEERGPAPCAGEPVTAAGGDASERSAGSAVVTSKQVACLFIRERKISGVLLSKATRGHVAPTNQPFLYLQTPAYI